MTYRLVRGNVGQKGRTYVHILSENYRNYSLVILIQSQKPRGLIYVNKRVQEGKAILKITY